MVGWALRLLVIWGGLGLLFYAFVANRLLPPPHPAGQPAVVAAPAAAPTETGRAKETPNSLVYRSDSQGHVLLNGEVNGAAVHFIVDTGATYVSLTLADAQAAGYSRSDLDFSARTATANGVGRGAMVTLREIRVGQFSVYDVPAFVGEGLPISLLGQSFLTRLESYKMEDGVLTLNWN